MKAIIIDDEKHCSESLSLLLRKYAPDVKILGEANDPFQGIGLITAHKPDVVFLDIEMPHLSGFEMLNKLDKIDFEIVFTTAYDEFALRAFKVNAIDYLLKPIDHEDLNGALEKVRERLGHDHLNLSVKALLNEVSPKHKADKKIGLPTMEGLEFVKACDIIRCESDSNYTYIHLSDKKITISKTLKEIQQLLEGLNFYRVHNSHLINLDKIKRYQRGSGGVVIMDNDEHVHVSRSKKADFLNRI